ncbi:MAG: IS66 family insertion sequence element accessory protein TnpB, partial [Marinilabiliaceae bacterium]
TPSPLVAFLPSGHLFVFRNKKGNAIKLLVYDGQGFWLCQKRLSQGRFAWWPDKTSGTLTSLAVYELHSLDNRGMQNRPVFNRPAARRGKHGRYPKTAHRSQPAYPDV